VSMPYFGLSPFLPDNGRFSENKEGVSMPYFGLSPFLPDNGRFSENKEGVSMPYFGLSPFLQKICNSSNDGLWCQCPTSGSLHFYCWSSRRKGNKKNKVSMPYFGLSSFLRYALETRINTGFPGPFLQVIHRIF